MFSYYGSKSKIIDYYPVPKYSKIIEPFAGSARYALKWFDRDVLLVDKWDVIIKIWHYLQAASPADIMALPEPAYKESIDKYNLAEGERLLMGFMANPASSVPKREIQKFSDIHRNKGQIANQLYKIKHWDIRQGDYRDILNQEATWFIDPPYQTGGEYYKHHSVDFASLAQWSQSRLGQVIVCENTKAHWLPFWPIKQLSGAYSKTTEAIWCNEFQQPALW